LWLPGQSTTEQAWAGNRCWATGGLSASGCLAGAEPPASRQLPPLTCIIQAPLLPCSAARGSHQTAGPHHGDQQEPPIVLHLEVADAWVSTTIVVCNCHLWLLQLSKWLGSLATCLHHHVSHLHPHATLHGCSTNLVATCCGNGVPFTGLTHEVPSCYSTSNRQQHSSCCPGSFSFSSSSSHSSIK